MSADTHLLTRKHGLEADSFSTPWGHSRSYASCLTCNANVGNGVNWQVAQWPYLVRQDDGGIAIMGKANDVLWFDAVPGGSFKPRFSVRRHTVLLDTFNGVYRLVHLDGSITEHDQTTAAFRRHLDAAGNSVAVV